VERRVSSMLDQVSLSLLQQPITKDKTSSLDRGARHRTLLKQALQNKLVHTSTAA